MKNILSLIVACAALGLSACGYHLLGSETHLPQGVSSVTVEVAKNKTLYAGLEQTFTEQLIETLRADGRVRVADPKQADAILRSELIDAKESALAFDKFGRVNMMEVTISARLSLVSSAGKEIWTSGKLIETEEYPVGDDFLGNERLRNAGLVQVSRRLCRTAVEQLTSGF